MPSWEALYAWSAGRDPGAAPGFMEAYAHANKCRADVIARDKVRECVEAPLDTRFDGKLASAGVQRETQRANYYRWLAGCLDRDTYGERPPQVNVQVNPAFVTVCGGMAGKVEGE